MRGYGGQTGLGKHNLAVTAQMACLCEDGLRSVGKKELLTSWASVYFLSVEKIQSFGHCYSGEFCNF